MKRSLCFFLLFLFCMNATAAFAESIQHQMTAVLDPVTQTLQVEDRITFPEEILKSGRPLTFLIHGGLNPRSSTPGVRIQREESSAPAQHSDLPIEQFRVILEKGVSAFALHYAGKIHHPLKEEGENYGRRFQETPGIISEEGIFLAGTSFWYPVFQESLVRFSLDVRLPQGWDSVSQGARTLHSRDANKTIARWASPEPQEEIYLIGGPWTEYQRAAGKIDALVFLRTPDKTLAEAYLQATVQYLEMYQKLLGPYPYQKFALVENFWETGYGMPSFTLLGPGIIRMPFILHSSYPHEILHNWWGNGVYLDYEAGNWAEGLTTYLADHLIAEQRGKGLDSRQATLQKYTDYVSGEKDFPLTAFRQRESAATEAIGYGKTLMLFHMLHMELGDEAFVRALQHFYKAHRFQRAGFSDLERAFSESAGHDVSETFEQWVKRTGAPKLRVKTTKVERSGSEFRLIATLQQTQVEAPYLLQIPIAVTLEGEERAAQTTVSMVKKELSFSLVFEKKPLKLDIDPEFDLFRRLDRNEIPPALSLAFGAEKVLIILPSKEDGEMRGAYDELARAWQKGRLDDVEIQWDMDLKRLPKDRAVWVLGWKNQFQRAIRKAFSKYEVTFESNQVQLAGQQIVRNGHSVVMTGPHPDNSSLALSWLAAGSPEAMPGLARKLPHYGRYSYLGFEGDEPSNMLKGVWPLLHSPLSIQLTKESRPGAGLNPRSPLTAAFFSEKTTSPQKTSTPVSAERKIGIGTVHDLSYEEEGVRISGTTPGSPAEKAGLKEGDVLYWIGSVFLRDIRTFAATLKTLKPGIKVKLLFMRDDKEQTVWMTPEAR